MNSPIVAGLDPVRREEDAQAFIRFLRRSSRNPEKMNPVGSVGATKAFADVRNDGFGGIT